MPRTGKYCRYRYANGSPKQRKFADGHQFAKTTAAFDTRPAKFPARKISASATYRTEHESQSVEIFDIPGQTARTLWRQTLAGMKADAKMRDPERYRRKLSVRRSRSKK